jgi:hypothetical protein
MAAVGSEVDVVFYNLIHQLAEVPSKGGVVERRHGLRKQFLVTQRIAPGYRAEMPPDEALIEVRCYDLTRSGFSFLVPTPPDFNVLVAAFGWPPSVIYVAAEVLHCRDVLLHRSGRVELLDNRSGQPRRESSANRSATAMVLVGCRFLQRLGQ